MTLPSSLVNSFDAYLRRIEKLYYQEAPQPSLESRFQPVEPTLSGVVQKCEDLFVLCASFLPPGEAFHPIVAVRNTIGEERTTHLWNKTEEKLRKDYRAQVEEIVVFYSDPKRRIEPSKLNTWKQTTMQAIDEWTLDSISMINALFQLFHSLDDGEFNLLKDLSPQFLCLRGEWFVALKLEKKLRQTGSRGPIAFQNIPLMNFMEITKSLYRKGFLDEAVFIANRMASRKDVILALRDIFYTITELDNPDLLEKAIPVAERLLGLDHSFSYHREIAKGYTRHKRFEDAIGVINRVPFALSAYGIYQEEEALAIIKACLDTEPFDLRRVLALIAQLPPELDSSEILSKTVKAYTATENFDLDQAIPLCIRIQREDTKAFAFKAVAIRCIDTERFDEIIRTLIASVEDTFYLSTVLEDIAGHLISLGRYDQARDIALQIPSYLKRSDVLSKIPSID